MVRKPRHFTINELQKSFGSANGLSMNLFYLAHHYLKKYCCFFAFKHIRHVSMSKK